MAAYRTSARTQPNDTAVCCARCETLAAVSLETSRDGRFQCRKCDFDQPVLRGEDDLELDKLALADFHLANYDQLRPFARELGKDFDVIGLDLVCDGLVGKLALSINSGTVMGLDHVVAAAGLPKMRFLVETPSHVAKKQDGVIKEVQTGDAAFDDWVYIESADASDADVLTVLSAPAVRKAIRELLGESGAVVVSETGVSLFVDNKAGPYIPKDIRKRLSLLRVVAGAPRPLVQEDVVVPARVTWTKLIVGLAAPFGVLMFVLGHAQWSPVHSQGTVLSMVGGLFLAGLLAPVYTLLLRGRSTSHREILTLRIVTFIFAPLLVPGLLLTYNGAFDSSPGRNVEMKIENVSKDDESGKYHATVHDESGAEHTYVFSSEPKKGAFVRVDWKDGALGWTWENGDPTVVEAPVKP